MYVDMYYTLKKCCIHAMNLVHVSHVQFICMHVIEYEYMLTCYIFYDESKSLPGYHFFFYGFKTTPCFFFSFTQSFSSSSSWSGIRETYIPAFFPAHKSDESLTYGYTLDKNIEKSKRS